MEGIFTALFDFLKAGGADSEIEYEWHEMPHRSDSIFHVFMNCLFARRNAGDVNHVVGDTHYAVIGLAGYRTMLTIHDCVLLNRYSKFHPKYWVFYYLWYALPVRWAAKITAVSMHTKKELDTALNTKREINVIHNFYHPDMKWREHVFNEDKPVLLQVGAKNNKNLERVIPAIQEIRCHLIIVGHLSVHTKLLLDECEIEYTNYHELQLKEMISLYNGSDVILFVSTYEGFGMPIIEAQAIGRAVVTSNIEPMKSIAGEGACLADPYSVADIHENIYALIHNKHYREAVIESGKRNAGNYRIEKTAAQYTNLYASISHTLDIVIQ